MSFINELNNEIRKADARTRFDITLVTGVKIELAVLEIEDGEDYLTILRGIDSSKHFDDDPDRYPRDIKVALSAIATYKVYRLEE